MSQRATGFGCRFDPKSGEWPQTTVEGCRLFRRCQEVSRHSANEPKSTLVTLSSQQPLERLSAERYRCDGPDINKMYTGAASYLDCILRGANPAELPVQAPTEFELIVSQRTALQLGQQLPRLRCWLGPTT